VETIEKQARISGKGPFHYAEPNIRDTFSVALDSKRCPWWTCHRSAANRLVRWAAVEAVQRVHRGAIGRARARIGQRRGTNIAKVAAARKLLTLVYYGLRDGTIRCLARPA